jgi:tRNA uridine 5-carbamoylmethylation protein Kti12
MANYGSGKTEFALNYAIKLRKENEKVAVADIDVVNLYFRSRDKKELFEKAGIKIISSHQGYERADSPAISAEVVGYINNEQTHLVLDVGGDANGATVLGSLSKEISKHEYNAYLVVNANRPFTKTVNEIIELHHMLEAKSKIKITGLINNTNLQEYTTEETIKKGEKIVDQASAALDIPVVYNGVYEAIYDDVDKLKYDKFKIRRFMNKPWEKMTELKDLFEK